jgi:hypothetical protein
VCICHFSMQLQLHAPRTDCAVHSLLLSGALCSIACRQLQKLVEVCNRLHSYTSSKPFAAPICDREPCGTRLTVFDHHHVWHLYAAHELGMVNTFC